MLGTEQLSPQEGDKSCVNLAPYKSTLVQRLKASVHSLLDTSINQPIARVQQTFTEVRGRLSRTVGSLDQAIHGIVSVEKIRIITGQLLDIAIQKILDILEDTKVSETLLIRGQKSQDIGVLQILQKLPLLDYIERIQHTALQVCRHTALVTLGIAPLNLGGAC